MRYVVDTNVVSELMRPDPAPAVIDWFQDHPGQVYLTSVTIKELYYGVLRLPEGRRRERLAESLAAIVMDCSDKTLPFDAFSGYLCADLHRLAEECGRPSTIEDLMIASIALRNDATLVTRNVKDFDFLHIPLENPFE